LVATSPIGTFSDHWWLFLVLPIFQGDEGYLRLTDHRTHPETLHERQYEHQQEE